MPLSYYREPAEGIDAQYELAVLHSHARPQARWILSEAQAVIEGAPWPAYALLPWGALYLFETGNCFGFLRRADDAPSDWLWVMFGQWMKDDRLQRRGVARRFNDSHLQ